jgi:hypothetical protein
VRDFYAFFMPAPWVSALFLRPKENTASLGNRLASRSKEMDIVWIAALALFWVALIVGVDGLARLARSKGERA